MNKQGETIDAPEGWTKEEVEQLFKCAQVAKAIAGAIWFDCHKQKWVVG